MTLGLGEPVVLLTQPPALRCGVELVEDGMITLAAGKALWMVGGSSYKHTARPQVVRTHRAAVKTNLIEIRDRD